MPDVAEVTTGIAIPRLRPRPIARRTHQARRLRTPRQPPVQHRQPLHRPEPPHRAISKLRTARASGADAVSAVEAFVGGDEALVSANTRQRDKTPIGKRRNPLHKIPSTAEMFMHAPPCFVTTANKSESAVTRTYPFLRAVSAIRASCTLFFFPLFSTSKSSRNCSNIRSSKPHFAIPHRVTPHAAESVGTISPEASVRRSATGSSRTKTRKIERMALRRASSVVALISSR